MVSPLYEFFHDSLKYEFLATLLAAEWFLSSVGSFMSLQMTLCGAFLVPAAQILCNLSYHAQKQIADKVDDHLITFCNTS